MFSIVCVVLKEFVKEFEKKLSISCLDSVLSFDSFLWEVWSIKEWSIKEACRSTWFRKRTPPRRRPTTPPATTSTTSPTTIHRSVLSLRRAAPAADDVANGRCHGGWCRSASPASVAPCPTLSLATPETTPATATRSRFDIWRKAIIE